MLTYKYDQKEINKTNYHVITLISVDDKFSFIGHPQLYRSPSALPVTLSFIGHPQLYQTPDQYMKRMEYFYLLLMLV
jgi:hypothetical protein